MASTTTRFGKVLTINGSPVEKYVVVATDAEGEEEILADSMLWRAGQTIRAKERAGLDTVGYVWNDETQDFEESESIREEGIKREQNALRRAAELAGKPVGEVKAVSRAQFTEREFRDVRSFGEFIVQLAKIGKKEAIDEETALDVVARSVALYELLGLHAHSVSKALKAIYEAKEPTNA